MGICASPIRSKGEKVTPCLFSAPRFVLDGGRVGHGTCRMFGGALFLSFLTFLPSKYTQIAWNSKLKGSSQFMDESNVEYRETHEPNPWKTKKKCKKTQIPGFGEHSMVIFKRRGAQR